MCEREGKERENRERKQEESKRELFPEMGRITVKMKGVSVSDKPIY